MINKRIVSSNYKLDKNDFHIHTKDLILNLVIYNLKRPVLPKFY